MKFKNETKEDVMFPVIYSDNLPSDKLIIKDGETKDVPECAIKTAESYGLTPVDEVKEIVESPVDEVKEIVESPVEAEESSISEVKVETKKVKKAKRKKVE